jgi:group II intron reverse transcriptase/maturase
MEGNWDKRRAGPETMSRIYYTLYDRLLHRKALAEAFAKVKRNRGAAGIDGQTIEDFAGNLEAELDRLIDELRTKEYEPLPVRRVSIPKSGGGERHLGIPSVRDRVVQQALLSQLQPIFDPEFHPSSYGYRPGRSCQQAVSKAVLFMREYERSWCVDLDIRQCFDSLDHDLILEAVRRRVRDGSVLELIRKYLRSGVMVEGEWQENELGSPQGGVISPLLMNIYLDAFDQEMRRRGHRMVRYADDILILCRSKGAAHRAMTVACHYLERALRLKVNSEKTRVVHISEGVRYLGIEIHSSWITIQRKKKDEFVSQVKGITRRNSPVNLEKAIRDLNLYLRGFANYFQMANCKTQFGEWMRWIRRRLRSKQLALWKKPGKLFRVLRQRGYRGEYFAMGMRRWRTSRSDQASKAMPNAWFELLGLFDLTKVQTGVLPETS